MHARAGAQAEERRREHAAREEAARAEAAARRAARLAAVEERIVAEAVASELERAVCRRPGRTAMAFSLCAAACKGEAPALCLTAAPRPPATRTPLPLPPVVRAWAGGEGGGAAAG